ncbi:VCBS domain-containing protein [Roseomonas sp. GCM10028921]
MAAFDNVQTAAQWGGYWGTSGRDQLVGTNIAEQFAAGDGDDEIAAGGGDDRAYGGNGNDTVSGGIGNDYITGDAGCDVLSGDEGVDTLYGGDGNDTLRGGACDGDVVNGGSGADTYIYGVGDGRDVIEGLNRWEGDKVDLRYYAAKLNGITSLEGLKAAGMVVGTQQWGGDTLIKFSGTDILTIRWVNPRDLTNDMFLFAKPPTDVQITKSTVDPTGRSTVAENSAAGTKVGVLSASDPDYKDTFTYKIVCGGDAFGIDSDGVTLVTKQSFDFEAKSAHSVTVQVTDQWGLSFEKELTIAVGNVNEAPTGYPVLKGEPRVGEILEADTSGIRDGDGLGELNIQWQRVDDNGNWVDIRGASGSTYKLTQDDAATTVRSVVSYVDKGHTTETVASAPSNRVTTPSTAPSDAKVITFENITLEGGAALGDGAEVKIGPGYEGLNWKQGGAYNPTGSLGYTTSSGNVLAFIGEMDGGERDGYEGTPGSPLTITRAGGGDFSVFGADFSSAHTDNLSITVRAWDDGAIVGEIVVKADRFFADHFNFEGKDQRFTSVDKVEFIPKVGSISGGYFGLDDLAMRFTNEAPVVSGAVTGSATEGAAGVTLNALANATDADDATTMSVVNLPTDLPAGVTYEAATHSFTLDPANAAFQHLAADSTQVVTVNYDVSDGTATTPASVSWTVTGTNDAATMTESTSFILKEDTALKTASGLVIVSDVDDAQAVFGTVTSTNHYGHWTFNNVSGEWGYELTNNSEAVQALITGEIVADTLTVTSKDGTAFTTVTASIQGTDEPVTIDLTYVAATPGTPGAPEIPGTPATTVTEIYIAPLPATSGSNVNGQWTSWLNALSAWRMEEQKAHGSDMDLSTQTTTVTKSNGTKETFTYDVSFEYSVPGTAGTPGTEPVPGTPTFLQLGSDAILQFNADTQLTFRVEGGNHTFEQLETLTKVTLGDFDGDGGADDTLILFGNDETLTLANANASTLAALQSHIQIA